MPRIMRVHSRLQSPEEQLLQEIQSLTYNGFLDDNKNCEESAEQLLAQLLELDETYTD